MTTRRLFQFFGLVLIPPTFILCLGCASLPPSAPGTRPKIINAYAQDTGRYRDPLKIYIGVDDPGGYIFRIAAAVIQVGYGYYPTSWIHLNPPVPNHLIGYLQWNTSSSNTRFLREWTQVTIEVSVFDTSGNESNAVAFPFTFVSERVPRRPPSPPFDQPGIPRIGFVSVDLYDPETMGDDHGLGGPLLMR